MAVALWQKHERPRHLEKSFRKSLENPILVGFNSVCFEC